MEKECQWHRFNISLQREEQHIDAYGKSYETFFFKTVLTHVFYDIRVETIASMLSPVLLELLRKIFSDATFVVNSMDPQFVTKMCCLLQALWFIRSIKLVIFRSVKSFGVLVHDLKERKNKQKLYSY